MPVASEVGSRGHCEAPLHALLLAIRHRIPRGARPSLDQGGSRNFAGTSEPAVLRWLLSEMHAGRLPRRSMQAEWTVVSAESACGRAELPQLGATRRHEASGPMRARRSTASTWAPAGIDESGRSVRRAGKTRECNVQAFRLGRVPKRAVRELRLILYDLGRRFALDRQGSVATTNALA